MISFLLPLSGARAVAMEELYTHVVNAKTGHFAKSASTSTMATSRNFSAQYAF